MSDINPNPLKLKSDWCFTKESLKEYSTSCDFMQMLDFLYDMFKKQMDGDECVIQDKDYIQLTINYPLSSNANKIDMKWNFTALVPEDLYLEISEIEKSSPAG